MKIKFVKVCKDKHTDEYYNVGQIKEFNDDRAVEIIKTGYAEEFKEEPKKVIEENTAVRVEVEKLSLKELKKCCKDLGLATSGTKQDLINRINGN